MTHDTGVRLMIANHFSQRWVRGYIRGKLRLDPVYRDAFVRLGDSSLPLLDIGCGMGVLAFYLRERGFAPAIIGVDVDTQKIARGAAVAAQHYSGITLQVGEGGKLPEFSGNVSLLDMLHYLAAAEQPQFLREVARRIAPGGWCIIRTTPRDGSWRFRCTQFEECFVRAIAWMTRPAMAYPAIEEIKACFPAEEFSAEVHPLWGRTPFNSWLLAFRRLD